MSSKSPRPAPPSRVRLANAREIDASGDFVLYWMVAARRTRSNFGLQHAAARARELGRPLVVLEGIRAGHRWASDRFHRFVLEGMRDNARALEGKAFYYPYVEPAVDAGKGLIAKLAERAALVVTDEFPCFMLPRMVAAGARQSRVRMEVVDSNGLLPLSAASQAFPTAYAFRRFLQRNLREHLTETPTLDPLARVDLPRLERLPREIERRWPRASDAMLAGDLGELARLPIDHSVAPVATRGGSRAAQERLASFLDERLVDYADRRADAVADRTSGLSPYLHFGHVSAHEVFAAIAKREGLELDRLGARVDGKPGVRADGRNEGWWGLPAHVETFLDELVTWRELGYVFAHRVPDHERYGSLPEWAQATLAAHARDRREHVYSLDELERARTHDPLWNAAQGQLLAEGRIHNYLRMLWGKKVLQWSATPRDALAALIELNNKYALDGRNPNSYSGIFWCLGRFDRPWAPERPIFGRVRYMSSENTARKLRVQAFIERHAPAGATARSGRTTRGALQPELFPSS